MGPIVKIPVGFALALSVATGLASLHSTGCTGNLGSSSAASSLVGLWQLGADSGVQQEVFFNSDGTCGFIDSYDDFNGTSSQCTSNFTYTVNGSALTITQNFDGGYAQSATVEFSISGDSLTVDALDAGGYSAVYTRVNADSNNSCP